MADDLTEAVARAICPAIDCFKISSVIRNACMDEARRAIAAVRAWDEAHVEQPSDPGEGDVG